LRTQRVASHTGQAHCCANNVSEGDIGGIKLNNSVQFSVDAFPNRVFEGTVTQVRQSPQTAQNVVTYDVVVSVGNADLMLKPGMTAAVRVITDQHNGVLRVPSQALRYAPCSTAPCTIDSCRRTSAITSDGTASVMAWLDR
jgi:hypothetical protein